MYKNIGTISKPQFQLHAEKAYKAISNKFRTETNPPQYENAGYCSPYIGDIDNDGKSDLILAAGSGNINSYAIHGKDPITDSLNRFENLFWVKNGKDSSQAYFGAQLRIAAGDLDSDGIKEIVIGNSDGGLSILSAKRIQQKISASKPQIQRAMVFPNPANEIINIISPSVPLTQYQFLDITGKVLLQNTINTIQLSIPIQQLISGYYLLVLQTSQGVQTHKIHIKP